MLKGRVRWVEGKQFVAEGGSGHGIVIDASPGIGGRNTGVTPMELIVMGTAGCTAVDVVYILTDRMHQEVTGLEVSADVDRRDTEPKVFTQMRMHYDIKGRGIKPDKVERALNLSLTKYCSASAMLEETAEVVATWTYLDEATGETFHGESRHGPNKPDAQS